MKRIVYSRPDGGISIIVPSPRFVTQFENEGEAVAAVMKKDIPADACDVCTCDEADIPADRRFRDAWIRDTSPSPAPISTDLKRARGIHMCRIRVTRDAALAAKDTEFLRAVEVGDAETLTQVALEKQALRDIPQTFDLNSAKDEKELAALWPPDLARPEVVP